MNPHEFPTRPVQPRVIVDLGPARPRRDSHLGLRHLPPPDVRRIDGGYEVVLYTMFAPPGGLFFRGNPEDGYYTKTYDEPSPSEREEIDRAVDRFLEQERAVQWIEEGRAKNAAIAAKFWKEEA